MRDKSLVYAVVAVALCASLHAFGTPAPALALDDAQASDATLETTLQDVPSNDEPSEQPGVSPALETEPVIEPVAAASETTIPKKDAAATATPAVVIQDAPDTIEAVEDKGLPDKFDLRDGDTNGFGTNVVTPVKLQEPFATCWGFASVAASETSIYSALLKAGHSVDIKDLDISELQVTWFVYQPSPEGYFNQGRYENGQWVGEGYNSSGVTSADLLNRGGYAMFAVRLLASGMGPLPEELAPYRNHENAIIFKDKEGKSVIELTPEQVSALPQDARDKLLSYAATLNGNGYEGTNPANWSLDDELRFDCIASLTDSTSVKRVITEAQDGSCKLDEDAIATVKGEIMAGRPMTTLICADFFSPGQSVTDPLWSNIVKLGNGDELWTHYTYKSGYGANHVVTIVGWDDNFSKDNFIVAPPGDGAWLVKNSWGASSNEFPNKNAWGNQVDGQNTGYFWISFYDLTAADFLSFEFDIASIIEYLDTGKAPDKTIYQYDLMMNGDIVTEKSSSKISYANVYHATEDQSICSFTVETTVKNVTVEYEVFLLGSTSANPVDGLRVAYEKCSFANPGIHTIKLAQKDWIAMRKGQVFALVVTQYSTDEMGKRTYYKVYTTASGKPDQTSRTGYEKACTWGVTNEHTTAIVNRLMAEGYSQDDAQVLADALVKTPDEQAAIKKEVAHMVALRYDCYDVGIVNAGESFSSAAHTNRSVWKDFHDEIIEKKTGPDTLEYKNLEFDNFSLKGVATALDFSTVAFKTIRAAAGSVAGFAGALSVTPVGQAVRVLGERVSDGAVKRVFKPLLEAGYRFAGFLRACVLVNGKEMPDGFGELMVKIPVDSKYNGRVITIYQMMENEPGNIRKIRILVKDGIAVLRGITATSTFAIVLPKDHVDPEPEPKPSPDPKPSPQPVVYTDAPATGDSAGNNAIMPLAGIMAASGAFAILMLRRRRREDY